MRIKYTKELLEDIIKRSFSIRQVLIELNLSPKGGSYKTIKNKIKLWSIDVSHFTGSGWNVGDRYRKFGKVAELKDILVKDSNYTNTYNLKNKLINQNLKNHICENCELNSWLNKPIPLELHHINGINNDHRIENIQLLCPNCHAQTDNYRGKNIKAE